MTCDPCLPAGVAPQLRRVAAAMARRTAPILDADDLLQEARVAVAALPDGAPDSHAFVRGRNAMVDHVRAVLGRTTVRGTARKANGNRDLVRFDAWLDLDGARVEDPAVLLGLVERSAEDVALVRLAASEAAAALGALSVRDREFALCAVRGETLRAAADRHGVTEARACQVRTRTRRALSEVLA